MLPNLWIWALLIASGIVPVGTPYPGTSTVVAPVHVTRFGK